MSSENGSAFRFGAPWDPRTKAPWDYETAQRLHKERLDQEAYHRETGRMLDAAKGRLEKLMKVERELDAIGKRASALVSQFEREAELRKSQAVARRAAELRDALGKAEKFRKTDGWLKIGYANRQKALAAERACHAELRELEAAKGLQRSAADQAAEHRRAMQARGVDFHRMGDAR